MPLAIVFWIFAIQIVSLLEIVFKWHETSVPGLVQEAVELQVRTLVVLLKKSLVL